MAAYDWAWLHSAFGPPRAPVPSQTFPLTPMPGPTAPPAPPGPPMLPPSGGAAFGNPLLGVEPMGSLLTPGAAPPPAPEGAPDLLGSLGRGFMRGLTGEDPLGAAGREGNGFSTFLSALGWGGGEPMGPPTPTPLEMAERELAALRPSMEQAQMAGLQGGGMGAGTDGGGGAVAPPRLSGSTRTIDLGPVFDPGEVPDREVVAPPDMSGYIAELQALAPQEPGRVDPLLGILAGVARGALSADNMGDLILGGALGGIEGLQDARAQEAKQRYYYNEQAREHALAVAQARLSEAELGAEYTARAAETRHANAMDEYRRNASVLEARQPRVEMGQFGLVIEDVGPDGNRRMRLDNTPVMELYNARAALSAAGASRRQKQQFTQQMVNTAEPEGVASMWAMDIADSPELWEPIFGERVAELQEAIQMAQANFEMGTSGFGGEAGNRMKTGMWQESMVNTIKMMLMNDPEVQKRYLAVINGRVPLDEDE